MPFSPDLDQDGVHAVAERLSPGQVASVAPRSGGGNNRLYRVDLRDGQRFALKCYPRPPGDRRDRLGTEWAALSFLAGQGVSAVAKPIALDRQAGFALHEWIEGVAVTGISAADIDQAVGFAARLHELRGASEAGALPLASEACLSLDELLAQIERRYRRLAEVAADEPELAAFLEDEFMPMRRRIEARHNESQGAIAPEKRTLSPSDFGFHNALRRPDGRLAFVDFEYFGWDDPVKLAADFLQHPGMSLSEEQAGRFTRAVVELYGGDRSFAQRLRLHMPLYGLRWCLILLNEFLPERWHNRAFAGAHADRRMATRTQLTKARNRLALLGRIGRDQQG